MTPLDQSYRPRKGDRILFALAPGAQPYSFASIRRVARDGSWADMVTYSAGRYWSKRQPLPWRISGGALASPNHDDAYLLGLLWDPSRDRSQREAFYASGTGTVPNAHYRQVEKDG